MKKLFCEGCPCNFPVNREKQGETGVRQSVSTAIKSGLTDWICDIRYPASRFR